MLSSKFYSHSACITAEGNARASNHTGKWQQENSVLSNQAQGNNTDVSITLEQRISRQCQGVSGKIQGEQKVQNKTWESYCFYMDRMQESCD